MAAEPMNVNEWQELARQVLPKKYYDYYAGGAEDEFTLRENAEAFRRITFRPRVLVNVSKINLSASLFGHDISAPILIAPTAFHALAHPEGEVATARGAAACNTIMTLSFSSSRSLEEVAASCNAVRFFQLYICKNREITIELVQRAENNGYKGLVLTIDRPRIGRKEADKKNKLSLPPFKNLEDLKSIKIESFGKGWNLRAFAAKNFDDSPNWQFIGWLKSITKLPILIKGVLTHEDATKAVELGVDGIIVSNHGGRQLDYSPATISVLEEVVHAVGRKVPVLVDGGIRRGTDVFKALALGAQAVLIGRPVLFGLAVKGEDGVRNVIEMLKSELELTMALSGCPSLTSITRNHVRTDPDRLRSLL